MRILQLSDTHLGTHLPTIGHPDGWHRGADHLVIGRKHLPRFLKDRPEETASTSLAEQERRLILRVLKEANWNKHDAARRLKLSRSTLYSKIRRYNLEPNAAIV